MSAPTRSATLLVRVWLEDGPDTLRARLVEVTAAEERQTVAVAASAADVVAAVEAWLHAFVV